MKGLLIKEKYGMWHNCKVFLIVPLFFMAAMIAIALQSHGTRIEGFPVGMVFMFMGLMPATMCNVEIQNKWQSYCLTLPYSRSQIVGSKYICTLIVVALTVVFSAVMLGLCVLIGGSFDIELVVRLLFMGIGMGLLPATLFFPFHFKLYNKTGGARLLFGGLIGGLVGGINSILMTMDDEITDGEVFGGTFIFMLVMMALFLLSWLISIAIFKRKDV